MTFNNEMAEDEDGGYVEENQPEAISSFLYFDNAQVGSIVVDNAAELLCAYSHVFGGNVKPDLDIADAYFQDGHRLALVVTPRFDDNESVSIDLADITTGDFDPEDPDAEPNCLEFSIKLLDSDETDAALAEQFEEDDKLEAALGEAANIDDNKVLGDETTSDDEGPCHRVVLLALPVDIEQVAIWVVPPGESPEVVDDDMLLQELPPTFTVTLAKPPATLKSGSKSSTHTPPGQLLQ